MCIHLYLITKLADPGGSVAYSPNCCLKYWYLDYIIISFTENYNSIHVGSFSFQPIYNSFKIITNDFRFIYKILSSIGGM